jgi:bifunctional UDP-N-acetylglucosamine pyrophosphorylase/glucosamine-1-phosphate N-acetyltransferase
MQRQFVKVVVLAAGKGTRMKSDRAKVMHEVFFAPMLHHVLTALAPLGLLGQTVVVTGHQAEAVEASLADFPVAFARQGEQLGTAHAVSAARSHYENFQGTVVILCGDTPLLRSETLRWMLDEHRGSGASLTVMTTSMADPTNYGRIISGPDGGILGIVEERDATAEQKAISEINAGVYCVDAQFLCDGLPAIDDNNRQGEFYLTDLVAIARAGGRAVGRFLATDSLEVLGVNSRLELAAAHRELQLRRNFQMMAGGVSIMDPSSVEISPGVVIGRDTVIERSVKISGNSLLGVGCRIGPEVVLQNCRLGDSVSLGPFSFLADCEIPAGQSVPAGTVRHGGQSSVQS